MSIRGGSHDACMPSNGDIIRSGVLKKAKTSKRKFFVLRAETPDALARLEYYDNEKKFRSGLPPKRCIPLKTCFNINKKHDNKHKFVIALYTKDDCFGVAFDTEEDLKSWLKDFLILQHGEEIPEGEVLKPKFEFVWKVKLCERGLGAGRTGFYRLCLTDKTITLLKIDEAIPILIELSLTHVRSCGNLKNFFFLEVGRMSELGPGEVWFEADDTNIALNIQSTVSHRFKLARERSRVADNSILMQESSTLTDFQPKGRTRSASATESTNNTITKSNSKKFNPIIPTRQTTSQGFRERCDSMPSRPRTSSEGHPHNVGIGWGKPYSVPFRCHFRDSSSSHHGSPPVVGSPVSPPSNSTGSLYSLADEHDGGMHENDHQQSRGYTTSTLTPDEVITEEDDPESPKASIYCSFNTSQQQQQQSENYMDMNLRGTQNNNQKNSNSASMSSVTSGTPSTDIRYADFPLDKVFSYVSTDDDDTRQGRAYSFGSKPGDGHHHHNNTDDNSRVRASSVGAKQQTHFNRILQPHHHIPGVKSNSAPLLGPTHISSSHSSISNQMGDLMEMDFSWNSTEKKSKIANSSNSRGKFMSFLEQIGVISGGGGDNNKKIVATSEGNHSVRSSGSRTISTSSENNENRNLFNPSSSSMVGHSFSTYTDMTGNTNPNITLPLNNSHVGEFAPYIDMTAGIGATAASVATAASAASVREDYMDMSGSSPIINSPKLCGNVLTMDDIRQFRRSHHDNNNRRSDYIDMMQRYRTNSNSSIASRTATSPGSLSSTADQNPDYLDMSGRNRRTNSFGSQMSSSPQAASTTTNSDQSQDLHARRTHEGYVDMTPGDLNSIQHHHHGRQNSSDSIVDGDYLDMSGVRNAGNTRSQPINIQTQSGNVGVKNSSPISSTSSIFPGGKLAASPSRAARMHLPLNPYSSLPRQKSLNSSKDSSLNSSATNTPSSSSTMFPMSLNSPLSPLLNSATSSKTVVKVPSAILNVPYKARKRPNNSDDYAMMDFIPATAEEESPYMNYCPPTVVQARIPKVQYNIDMDDYAIMKPGTFYTKSATLPRTTTGTGTSSTALANHLSNIGDKPNMCFMPIREKDEKIPPSSPSPKPGDILSDKLVLDERTIETANMECDDEGSRPYDRLKSPFGKLSMDFQRPSSTTGSEQSALSRPPSVGSEGINSRLGSNSSVYSSSSSACTVVNQPQQQETQQFLRLHYASLDLADSQQEDKNNASSTEANNLNEENSTFVYADIDFIKSEELNHRTNNDNNGSGSNSNSNAAVN